MAQSFLIISKAVETSSRRRRTRSNPTVSYTVSIYGNRVNLRDSISGSNTGFARAKKSDIVARRSRGKDQYPPLGTVTVDLREARLQSFPSRTPALPPPRLTHEGLVRRECTV